MFAETTITPREGYAYRSFGRNNDRKNVIKIAPLSLVTLNTNVSYERVLNEKFSLNTNVNFMPYHRIPYKMIDNTIDLNGEAYDALQYGTYMGFGVSPEVRFYPSGKRTIPKGFYMGFK
ncbi:MAG: hypothetical protein HC906_14640, partial [Bacteroidales bacterium]|nr:hypothetical protein [Bacteroidales bacterium]